MSEHAKIPIDPDAEVDLVSIIAQIGNFILNERVRAYNEGVDAGYEGAAKMLENGSFLHNESPAKHLAIEAAKAIRALKLVSSIGRTGEIA